MPSALHSLDQASRKLEKKGANQQESKRADWSNFMVCFPCHTLHIHHLLLCMTGGRDIWSDPTRCFSILTEGYSSKRTLSQELFHCNYTSRHSHRKQITAFINSCISMRCKLQTFKDFLSKQFYKHCRVWTGRKEELDGDTAENIIHVNKKLS